MVLPPGGDPVYLDPRVPGRLMLQRKGRISTGYQVRVCCAVLQCCVLCSNGWQCSAQQQIWPVALEHAASSG